MISGLEKDMPRTLGYSTRSQRCFDVQNWQAKGLINIIGVLLAATIIAVGLFFCSINSDFYTSVTQLLLPALPKHCLILINNASFEKRQNIQQVIINAGCLIEYLPPYSRGRISWL